MSVESFLQYFMAHNQAITNWLFVAVLALCALVALVTLVRRPSAEGGDGSAASAKEVETVLRKVMEEKLAGGGLTAAPATAPLTSDQEDLVPAQMAQALQLELESKKAELSKVQADLAAKDKSIQDLQASLANQPPGASSPEAAAGGGPSSEEADALKAKIAELETKLAEYSIIEDDIADLCLYKEENTRLKEELERAKSGQAPLIGEPVAAAAPEAASAVPAAAVAEAPAPGAAEATPAPLGISASDLDDLEAEFAAAVAAQKEEEYAVAAPPPAAEPTPAVVEPMAVEAQAEPDLVAVEAALTPEVPTAPDLTLVQGGASEEPDLAQMIAAEPEPDIAPDLQIVKSEPDPLSEELDTEKMMAEMASLNSVSTDESVDEHVLEEEYDTDKMSEEAQALDAEPLKKGS